MEVVLRAMVETDRNYVCSSYLKDYHLYHPQRFIPNGLYFEPQAATLAFLLNEASVTVACHPDAPDELLGFAIYQYLPEALALHYIYVRTAQRRKRVGRALLDSILSGKSMIIATHASDDYKNLRHKAGVRVVYDPNLLQALRRLAS